jgi:hypothetical protein
VAGLSTPQAVAKRLGIAHRSPSHNRILGRGLSYYMMAQLERAAFNPASPQPRPARDDDGRLIELREPSESWKANDGEWKSIAHWIAIRQCVRKCVLNIIPGGQQA